MKTSPSSYKKYVLSCKSSLHKCFFIESESMENKLNVRFKAFIFLPIFILLFSLSGYAQRNKDVRPVIYCVKDLGNGLHQACFGYENPRNREVIVDEDHSKVKYNRGKKVAKGLAKFKKGSHNKVFTKEFGPGDYVEWTIINRKGKAHTVIANANSAKKCRPDEGFIFPVIGNGKSPDIIGQELTALCDDVSGDTPSDLIFQTDASGKILIEIVPKEGRREDVINLLLGSLFNLNNTDFLLYKSDLFSDLAGLSAIDVHVLPEDLCEINSHSDIINFARPVYPASNNSGGVLSQGDEAQTSNLVRESFRIKNSEGAFVPVDGSGITIGVLSDSYDMLVPGLSYADIDVSNMELPADVVVLEDKNSAGTDEGRAMMQIIHDVAPGAKLQFHAAASSARKWEVGYKNLAAECDIIVDDLTFITEPFFGSGRIMDAINNSGKIHFTSAGNVGNKAYQSTFNPTAGVPTTNFIDPASTTVAHDFNEGTGSDYLQKISVRPGTYLIALQWKEDVASQDNSLGALQDLDIYIVDDGGQLLVGSNRVNVAGDPTEIIVFRATGTGEANILITSANGPTNVPFRYIAFRTTAEDGTPDGLQIEEYFGNGAPTISGHAMNPSTVTVGAVDYRFGDNPVPEVFSSYGGLLPDGASLQIDMYAPDGGNTSFFGQIVSCGTCDNDEFPNFYGTSASAPHAAAAMALLQSALPAWHPPTDEELAADPSIKTNYTFEQALAAFSNTSTGFSVTAPPGSASGMLNTLAAFKSIASQTAKITELIVQDGKTPSAEPFTVTIIGEFFPEDVEDVTVLFGGQPLEDVSYATGANGETVITATVPTFYGNPELIIQTAGKTPGKLDETISDPAFILDEGKIALNIIANSAQFEFGQDIGPTYYRLDPTQPDYIPPFTVEGLPEGVTFQTFMSENNLPPIILNNASLDDQLSTNGYPIVADYVITPSFGNEVLTPEQLEMFQINFISGYNDPELGKRGYLTMNKKDIKIIAPDVTAVYGDVLDINLSYNYDDSGILNKDDFLTFIESAHNADFYDDNSLILINKLRAVVNEQQILDLLDKRSWMTTDRIIQNKLRAVVNGMNLIDLEAQHFDNYLNTETDPITNKLRAVVNKLRAVVNGQDLMNNNIDLLDPISNKLRAVVNETGINDEGSFSSFSEIFAVIDLEDGSTETENRTVDKLYAINLLSAMEVVEQGEQPRTYPGAFISPMSANFNTTYENGNVTFLPKELDLTIGNLVIPYGEELTIEKLDLITDFEGWAFEGEYQESEETVFPEGVPYYFIKVGGDGSELELNELRELGDYKIKVRNPQNYIFNHINDELQSIVTISPTVLTAETANHETIYGENLVAANLTTVFGDFAYEDESEETIFPDGIPYYFVDDDLNEYELNDRMNVGTYQIKIRGTDNYIIEYGLNQGILNVLPAHLSIKTADLELEYGDDLKSAITTVITGFASGEGLEEIFPDGISYIFMDELDSEFGIEAAKELGVYTVKVLAPMTSSNYEIFYALDHGLLTISPRIVNVSTENINEKYGYYTNLPDLVTQFIDFAPNETVADVFGPSGIPYYFVNAAGSVYNIGDKLALGDYDIRIEETNDHYIFEFDTSTNVLSISKSTLIVSIEDLTIVEGDIPIFNASVEGFVYSESLASVFPDGIQYYIVDENGNEKDYYEPGQSTIKIRPPENYNIEYIGDGKLKVESRLEQIKVSLDCVENHYYHYHHHDHYYGKLKYTAHFKYVNPNDRAVIVNIGENNSLSGYGRFENDLPTVFLPGENTIEIRFDGRGIKWKLKSYEGKVLETDKAYASWYSKRCDRSSCRDDDDYNFNNAFVIYPNPIKDWLQIEQHIKEVCRIEIYNMYGMLYKQMETEPIDNQNISIDMSAYSNGPYIIRITFNGESKVYNIIKE